jgi:hypothetical protein
MGRKFNAWERVLEHHSNAYTIVQSTFFHDLMFNFADQINRPNHQVHHWLGSGKFCPVDVRDVGAANAAVLREGALIHHDRTYSLYGPQALSFQDMLEKLSVVLGYPIMAQSDITSDQVRDTMEGKLPSFNIEEVVQAQEVVATGHDMGMTPDLLKLVGYAHTVQSFFEDNKEVFMRAVSSTPQPQTTQTSTASPSIIGGMSPSRVATSTTVIEQKLISTPAKVMESTTIPETSIDQSTEVPSQPMEVKPGAVAMPPAATQPAVAET